MRRPKKPSQKLVSVSVHIPESIHETFTIEAEKYNVSIEAVILFYLCQGIDIVNQRESMWGPISGVDELRQEFYYGI